jgi:2-methylcitrate dehydratase PrpD
MNIVDELSSFIINTDLNDIPRNTVTFGKHLTAKIIASMLSGSKTLSGNKLISYIKEEKGEGIDQQVGIIGCGFKSNLEDAVFANGLFAHAAELEDDQFPSSTSDITVIPVIFPMADKFNLSGKEVLEATILGIEVMNRVGMYPLASKGFVELPFYGVIGACITAAKALKFNEEQIKGAIGIAMGRASGLVTNFGTDAHYIESALACRDGMLAALLAKKGMAGNPDIEGWLIKLLGAENVKKEEIVKDLGKSWYIHNDWIKKYPCCFITHRPIDILFNLRRKHAFNYDEVIKLEIDDGPLSKICDRPSPTNTDDARFSFQHAVAVALLYGEVDSAHFNLDRIDDPILKENRSKVKVVFHDDWPQEFLSGIARLTITLKDGREISGEIKNAIGAPDSPLNEEQVFDLYKKITKNILTEKDLEWTWETINKLENIVDLKPFLKKLTYL